MLGPRTKSLLTQIFEHADQQLRASAISLSEGEFIHSMIQAADVSNTIEIGCANGISSVFICDALRQKPSPRHVIVDPNQTTEFASAGLQKLAKIDIDFYELIQQPSEIALPRLLEQNRVFDFAFIDGYHTLDHTLLDFFYLNLLIRVGGYIVIDDNDIQPVNKAIRYISTYPSYRLIGTAGYRGKQRRTLNAAKLALATVLLPFTKLAGKSLSHEILDGSVVRPKSIVDLDYSTMVAFQKVSEDRRSNDWYEYF